MNPALNSKSCHPERSLALERQTKSKYLLFLYQPRILLLATALVMPAFSHAQGCSLCKDATAGSAPIVRQSLRRAILILGVPAGGIFVGILVLARRIKPREAPESTSQL